MRHLAYYAGWEKFEGLWNLLIWLERVPYALPILENVLLATSTEQASRLPEPLSVATMNDNSR